LSLELDALRFYVPGDAILTHPRMDLHIPSGIVAAKDSSKAVLKRHNVAIEDTICSRRYISCNDGILFGAPKDFTGIGMALLPGNIRQLQTY
jgi:hypothetical protein